MSRRSFASLENIRSLPSYLPFNVKLTFQVKRFKEAYYLVARFKRGWCSKYQVYTLDGEEAIIFFGPTDKECLAFWRDRLERIACNDFKAMVARMNLGRPAFIMR